VARFRHDVVDAFLSAAQAGDAATLRSLLEAGLNDLRKLNQALRQAASFGKAECFQLLLDAGADPTGKDENGNTMLMAAAGSGNEDILHALLAAGVDVNAANAHGYTPLMNAASERKVKAVRFLIAAGADVNAQSNDEFGMTPLKAARDRETVRQPLLDAGARLDPALDRAVARAKERGAEARAAGYKPVFKNADVEGFLLAASHGDLDALRELLAHGMPVDAADAKGHTALFRAITAGQRPAVELLRQAGADCHAEPPDMGRLHAAALSGSAEMVRAVLQLGCDANARDSNGFTPLINAAIFGHVEVVRALLEAGADPNLRIQSPLFPKNKGTTALEQARGNCHRAVVELLLRSGVPVGPAEFAYAAVKTFRTTAEQPAFAEVKAVLSLLCGHQSRPWSKRKGVFSFSLKQVEPLARRYSAVDPPAGPSHDIEWARQLIELLEAEVRAAGYCLVVSGIGYEPASLRLFPTSEKYAALVGSGTNGVNRGLGPREIIAWLLQLETENPFVLTECRFDSLAGRFVGPAVNAEHWAQRMIEFCPDLGDAPAALAEELERTRSFGFWWD
jgi:uncharacterized protein